MKKHVRTATFEDCPFPPEDIAIAEQVNLELGRERERKAGLVKPPGSGKTGRPVTELGTIAPGLGRKRPASARN